MMQKSTARECGTKMSNQNRVQKMNKQQERSGGTFFPPAKISMALGKIPAVFARLTQDISANGIIFCNKSSDQY